MFIIILLFLSEPKKEKKTGGENSKRRERIERKKEKLTDKARARSIRPLERQVVSADANKIAVGTLSAAGVNPATSRVAIFSTCSAAAAPYFEKENKKHNSLLKQCKLLQLFLLLLVCALFKSYSAPFQFMFCKAGVCRYKIHSSPSKNTIPPGDHNIKNKFRLFFCEGLFFPLFVC